MSGSPKKGGHQSRTWRGQPSRSHAGATSMCMQWRYKTCPSATSAGILPCKASSQKKKEKRRQRCLSCPVGQGERRRGCDALCMYRWILTNVHVHVQLHVQLHVQVRRVPARAVRCVMSALVSCATKFLAGPREMRSAIRTHRAQSSAAIGLQVFSYA